ncbi:MAG: RelA/SpoT family protein [Patescibacteria group bacterium]
MEWEEYQKKLLDFGYDVNSISIVKKAFDYASQIHAKEKRMSGDSYIIHPIAVSLKIAKLKLDAQTISAALLHDTIENQGITISEIKKLFGDEVAFLVDGVTKVDRVRYHGIERAVESIRKMFLALAEDVRVVIIKLMDRLHNMKTLEFVSEHKRKRIALETMEIFAPLADRLGMWELKAELEDLAFPYVHPEEYKWLVEQIKGRREEAALYLEKLELIVESELKKDEVVPIAILYRTKHLFSIWKKLVRNEMDFGRVLDLAGIRIIVNNVEDCYRTLGIIHKIWKPMPGHIKDYIALPKPNGYQSLHTTVFGPHRKVIDFQIRTQIMNQEAEYGIAAHWAYDEGGKKKIAPKLDDKKFAWVEQLQEWHKSHEGSTIETLNALKIDFFKDRIFVLTPKGEVIDLPEGATPIDFAYHIHSEIGDHMFGARVNGKMVPFSHALQLGNHVEIITQKNKHPTSDWLDYAKTSIARNRIRAYLRKTGGLDIPKKNKKNTEAIIVAKDRVGLLKDVALVFSSFNINILDHKSDHQARNYVRIIVRFLPRKNVQFSTILTHIKKIKGIESVLIQEDK